MSDVASILGIKPTATSAEDAFKSLTENKPKAVKIKQSKPAGMARELFQLVGQDSIAPSVQPAKITPAFKTKRSMAKGRWIWAPFMNSGRTDGKEFYHWQRADIQFNDYSFAKFNVKVDQIRYTDEEYSSLLANPKWSRSETDYIMFICHKFDLRWPVIGDRYSFQPPRPVEEIQERYFEIVTKLQARRSGGGGVGGGSSSTADAAIRFDVNYEKERRHQQDSLLRNNSLDDSESRAIREELRAVDYHLKKLNKLKEGAEGVESKLVAVKSENDTNRSSSGASGGAEAMDEGDAGGDASEEGGGNAKRKAVRSSSGQKKGAGNDDVDDDASVGAIAAAAAASTGPREVLLVGDGDDDGGVVPGDASEADFLPGLDEDDGADGSLSPCMQSTRLIAPEYTTHLSEVLLKKMHVILAEFGILPELLLPTMAVCDMYDAIRRDIVTLLSVKKALRKKEAELAELRRTEGAANGGSSSDVPNKGDVLNIGEGIVVPSNLLLQRKFPLPGDAVPSVPAGGHAAGGSHGTSQASSASGGRSSSQAGGGGGAGGAGGGGGTGSKGHGRGHGTTGRKSAASVAAAKAAEKGAAGLAGAAGGDGGADVVQQLRQKKKGRVGPGSGNYKRKIADVTGISPGAGNPGSGNNSMVLGAAEDSALSSAATGSVGGLLGAGGDSEDDHLITGAGGGAAGAGTGSAASGGAAQVSVRTVGGKKMRKK